MTTKNRSPKNNVDTKVLRNWHPLDDPVGRVLDNQNSNVNTRRQPRVLLPDEIGVFPDSHDSGERECSFVESLEKVREDHD